MANPRWTVPRFTPPVVAALRVAYVVAAVQRPQPPMAGGSAAPAQAAQQMGQPLPIDADRVKARYLFNLARFITWPDEPGAHSAVPLHICLPGDPALRRQLDRFGAAVVRGRPVMVRLVHAGAAATGCQMLFVPGTTGAWPGAAELAAAGVPTVGESEQFLRDGGLASLLASETAVHVALNYRAARRAGFAVDAGLLDVARRPIDARAPQP